MIRKKIKYIKGFILFALFSILAFSPLCFIGAHAYHIDSNGNFVSDNLIDNSTSVFEMGAVSYNIGNTYVQNKVASNARIRTINLVSVDSSLTYSLSVPSPYLVIAQGYNNGLQVSQTGTQFNQALSSLSFSGVDSVSIIVRKSDNSNFASVNDISNIDLMFNVGNVKDYEPYGAVYYSQENYDNVLTNNYGLFTYCTSIDLKLTSTIDNSIITDSWNNIAELLADKSYVHCSNGEFSYNNSSLSMDYLAGASTHRVMWQFNFKGTYPPISNFNSFTASGYNARWQLINQNNSLIAYENIDNNALVDLSAYDNEQFGYFQLFTDVPGVAVNRTSLYFNTYYDVAYTRGYTIGYNNGVSYADSKVDIYSASYEAGRSAGFNTGYQDGYDASFNTINVDSASYIAGQNSNGGYSTGFAAGYAKGRTDQSTITDTNIQASDLLWTIGSTPWESFKNIWNVNLLGVNLANLVTGFITAIILIWIIKKFWK